MKITSAQDLGALEKSLGSFTGPGILTVGKSLVTRVLPRPCH